MKELLKLLEKEDLFSIGGMTTELGWKTKRTNLNNLKECKDWLRNKPKNSLRLFFDGDVFKDIKL
tara:strand:+ start:364 stop:558 length:195 start_codon:yes stop_codon:yes gene_type:complete